MIDILEEAEQYFGENWPASLPWRNFSEEASAKTKNASEIGANMALALSKGCGWGIDVSPDEISVYRV